MLWGWLSQAGVAGASASLLRTLTRDTCLVALRDRIFAEPLLWTNRIKANEPGGVQEERPRGEAGGRSVTCRAASPSAPSAQPVPVLQFDAQRGNGVAPVGGLHGTDRGGFPLLT